MIVYSITDFNTISEEDKGGENFIIVSFAKSLSRSNSFAEM